MDRTDRAVFLPHYGEFGWLILHHVRYVAAHRGESKIVCCASGCERLYPTATGFFTAFEPPLRDDDRWGDGSWSNPDRIWQTDDRLRTLLGEKYPGHVVVRPEYDCCWHTSDLVKFRPIAPAELLAVDIAVGVRKRVFAADGNYGHWPEVVSALRGLGHSVGLVGAQDTSFDDIEADACAWNHSEGPTSGTIDLLSRCQLFVGTDTGLSHLAALMDAPSLVWYVPRTNGRNLIPLVERANKGYFRRLPDEHLRPDEVVGGVIRCLLERRRTETTASS